MIIKVDWNVFKKKIREIKISENLIVYIYRVIYLPDTPKSYTKNRYT